MTDLTRKQSRDRLEKRREPYWLRLGPGAYLGFRAGADTWIARLRGRDNQQRYSALGGAIEFDEARRRAELWIGRLAATAGQRPTRGTVKEALERYIADLQQHGRADTAKEVEGRFRTCVWNDTFAAVALETMALEDVQEWRTRLQMGRANRSVNRQVRAVVAGLNRAMRLGVVGNPLAWNLKPLTDDRDDAGQTAVFLDRGQRAAVIEAASDSAGRFLRGLELTGARPMELAAATVADLTGDALRLAHRKGRPPQLRIRFVVLDREAEPFFNAQALDRPPSAPLFTEDGQQMWRTHKWSRAVRAAIAAHNTKAETIKKQSPVPVAASAYSFRHARISELLQLYNIDPLTVASQTGTSIAMIEKTYLQFIPGATREKLAAVRAGRSPR